MTTAASLERFLVELTLERHGPIVRDADRIPHLPLWLYRENWRVDESRDEGRDDSAAIEAFNLAQSRQSVRDGRRRRAQRRLRVLSDDEGPHGAAVHAELELHPEAL